MSSRASSVPSSPRGFEMNSSMPPSSTAPSSPQPELQQEDEMDVDQKDAEYAPTFSIDEAEKEKRIQRLDHIIEQTAAYSSMLRQQMAEMEFKNFDSDSEEVPKKKSSKTKTKARGRKSTASTRRKSSSNSKKRASPEKDEDEEESDTEPPSKRAKTQSEEAKTTGFRQSALITGATLKDYQLEGVKWLIALDQNGLSGILADEMGLGKTLQTIAFNAYLRERRIAKHFLVVCPLSVMHNWADEYKKFAPSLPVCLYHGTPAERAHLRATVMKPVFASDDDETFFAFPTVITTYEIIMRDRAHLEPHLWGYIVVDEGHRLKNLDCKLMQEIKRYKASGRIILTGTPLQNNISELWSLMNFVLPDIFNDLDSFQEWFDIPTLEATLGEAKSTSIISALHTILKPFLLRRIKADVLKGKLPPKKEYVIYTPLTRSQKEFYGAILDGKGRQLLGKMLGDNRPAPEEQPVITSDGKMKTRRQSRKDAVEALEQEVEAESDEESEEEEVVRKTKAKQHQKPSRKIKKRDDEDELDSEEEDADYVDSSKPSKKIGQGSASKAPAKRVKKEGDVDYRLLEGSDRAYFDALENGKLNKPSLGPTSREAIALDYHVAQARKQANTVKLQNTVMQLRKICSHPYLFNWPTDPATLEPVLNEDLVLQSGKMMILDSLLNALLTSDSERRVLIFSQFKGMLDVMHDWLTDLKGLSVCRIDGSTSAEERRDQMRIFQEEVDGPRVFLLSTRAGGLGINLTRADTVIFYDQDWNPQMDAQAQDRAHRIGQTKPVLVFRLISAHTIEDRILRKANMKRRLEGVVIAKGQFKAPGARTSKDVTLAEMTASLLSLEAKKIDVVESEEGAAAKLSKTELDALLDRRPEVFSDTVKEEDTLEGAGEKRFAVYQGGGEGGEDMIQKLFGEGPAQEDA
ncbi:SNF2-family ATP dependent chromatin remodeling factor snf21 [Flagelloscypha sp. PMI_526]|nr:SNF2-family ATP dependent chromatin remodeling factor snf21 [Flagelloscypha sp. PMI_526]